MSETQAKPGPRKCDRCGYDLTGVVGPKCPECGLAIWRGVLPYPRGRAAVDRRSNLVPLESLLPEPGLGGMVLLGGIALLFSVPFVNGFLRAARGERVMIHPRSSPARLADPLDGMIHEGAYALLFIGAAIWFIAPPLVRWIRWRRESIRGN